MSSSNNWVTGRGVDLGWSRLSHFHRGVVFRYPVFNFNVKLFCWTTISFASVSVATLEKV
jgi:hypothetical protein